MCGARGQQLAAQRQKLFTMISAADVAVMMVGLRELYRRRASQPSARDAADREDMQLEGGARSREGAQGFEEP